MKLGQISIVLSQGKYYSCIEPIFWKRFVDYIIVPKSLMNWVILFLISEKKYGLYILFTLSVFYLKRCFFHFLLLTLMKI